MNLTIHWNAPISLVDGDDQNLIYAAHGLDAWEGVPGVYIFARIFNGEVIPLYIGKSENLCKRARQHFKTNTTLMKRIKKAKSGNKVIIFGKFAPKQSQNTKKCIALIERALINHALSDGYTLLNIQGTKTAFHKINFSGFLGARNLTGTQLAFKANA